MPMHQDGQTAYRASAAGVPLLAAEDICKSFFGVEVLHEVGFALAGRPGARPRRRERLGQVDDDEHHRRRPPDRIRARCHRRQALRAQGARRTPSAAASPSSTRSSTCSATCNIAENLFIAGFPKLVAGLPFIDRRAAEKTTRELLAAVDLDLAPTTPVSRLSPGRAPARRDRQGAGRQGARHHLRRADDLADQPRDRASVRHHRAPQARRASRSSTSATSWAT